MAFTEVIIIYNPKSTGNSKANAQELKKQLKKVLPHIPVENIPTQYAGHAEKLARELATTHKKLLIISSSGDGGYHEVVNGVMNAGNKSKGIVCAILPAGNANDHSRTMQDDTPLWKSIQKGKVTQVDLLRVSIEVANKKIIRYAHSYVGLGLTPVVATELNRHTLNALREASLVIKTFFKYRPFKIRRGKKIYAFDSLIFANINQMAKMLTLAENNKPTDGRFEVISFPHAHKLLLIRKLFKAATVGLKTNRREKKYTFEVIKKIPIQLDGEVTGLASGSKVIVAAAPKALRTII